MENVVTAIIDNRAKLLKCDIFSLLIELMITLDRYNWSLGTISGGL